MKIYIPFFILIITFLLIFLFQKFKLLLSNTGDQHQNFTTKLNVPLVGGVMIFLSFALVFKENLTFSLCFFFASTLLLGLFSDAKLISSAQTRLIFQFIITLVFFFLSNLRLSETGIEIIDKFNDFYLFNYLFASFCLIILINGSNFIDGLNGLCLGYYLLITYFIFKNSFNSEIFFNDKNLIIFILSLSIILFYNFLSKVFIGDNGSYILAGLFGIGLIEIYNQNNIISSFYIVLLLWYPCFELLFSMIRKYNFKKSPMEPDSDHLHHLFFYFLVKNFKIQKSFANNLTSLILLIFNFILFTLGTIDIYNSKKLCILISISIFLYIISYYALYNWKKNYLVKVKKR